MKFLHTADWHLGRHFHGTSLLADQAHVLDQFVALAADEQVDAVVVAGDVYDRAVPPADAVALLGDVLERLVVRQRIPVILIAGNHDSAERIAFGGRIFDGQRLHVRGGVAESDPIVLRGDAGEVAFHPLPYVEPAFARALEGGEAITDHPSAMAHVLARSRARFVAGQRNVLVGHAFVAGGSESESERPLSLGGSALVPAEAFAGFDYVALGHLHRPQEAGSQRIRYAGSLLKYSFQEAEHRKSVSVVRVDAVGGCAVREVALAPKRGVRIVTGTLHELLERAHADPGRDDYLRADLTDAGPVLDPLARLREAWPNVMEVRFVRAAVGADENAQARADRRRREPVELFQAFCRDVLGRELGPDHAEAFAACAGPLLRAPDGDAA